MPETQTRDRCRFSFSRTTGDFGICGERYCRTGLRERPPPRLGARLKCTERRRPSLTPTLSRNGRPTSTRRAAARSQWWRSCTREWDDEAAWLVDAEGLPSHGAGAVSSAASRAKHSFVVQISPAKYSNWTTAGRSHTSSPGRLLLPPERLGERAERAGSVVGITRGGNLLDALRGRHAPCLCQSTLSGSLPWKWMRSSWTRRGAAWRRIIARTRPGRCEWWPTRRRGRHRPCSGGASGTTCDSTAHFGGPAAARFE